MRAQLGGHFGTTDRPYSALDLRLALAAFGLVVSAVCAAVLFGGGHLLLGGLCALLALVAVVDLLVIQLRRNARKRGRRDARPHLH